MLGPLNSSIRRGTILGIRPWFPPTDLPAEQTPICLKQGLSVFSVGRLQRRSELSLRSGREAFRTQTQANG